jgi:adenylate cyclase
LRHSATGVPANPEGSSRLRRPLFQKYFLALFVAVVGPLLINGASEAWFGYRDHRTMLDRTLRIQADAAANRIQAFLDHIAGQLEWSVHLTWAPGTEEAHRLDALRVLRQVPAIASLMLVDGGGKERLQVSRLERNAIGSGIDRASDPAVLGLQANRPWYGPVTLNRGSEPYMTMAVAGRRAAAGSAVAEINLKLILEVIAAIRVGETGSAFVLDRTGILVAHPNISLVLQGADEATSARLRALQGELSAAGGMAIVATNVERRTVVAAMAPIPGPGWQVVVEQSTDEAYAAIRATLWRAGALVLGGALLATLLAYALARRMAWPIRQLEHGAALIGAGKFDHAIDIRTGDELERLATRFNRMAGELAVSQERSERIARLKRFLAPQVAELVERAGQDGLLDGQRAEVVVIFCDLRGFTAFSAAAEPDAIMRVLAEYHRALGAIIAAYEATLTSFTGDGLMLLLNAPVASPDEPALRGVRMAIEMRQAVQPLIDGWRQHGYAIGFGIGLAKGVATVGRIGYEGRLDYTAIGSVTNLASRLCAEARDGEILADGNVAAAVSATMMLTPAGSRPLKGFADPVPVYRILASAAAGAGELATE